MHRFQIELLHVINFVARSDYTDSTTAVGAVPVVVAEPAVGGLAAVDDSRSGETLNLLGQFDEVFFELCCGVAGGRAEEEDVEVGGGFWGWEGIVGVVKEVGVAFDVLG